MTDTTMRASVLTGPHTIELRTVPVPTPGPGQVLVAIDAVGVCGSDTHFYKKGAIGDLVVRGPLVLGHETGGHIVSVGEGVAPERVGEIVAVEPQTPCRHCRFCKAGRYNLCREIRFYGAWPTDGSFAQYALIDADFAYRVPEGMTVEEAALVEPLSVALFAVRRAGVEAGSRLLITGAGPIGVLVARVARAAGAVEVLVSDPVAHRREFVAADGIADVIDPAAQDLSAWSEHFDVYIDASGNQGAILSALPAISPGGIAVLVGMGSDELTVPLSILQHREVSLTGIFRYANTWPDAIALIASGRVRVDDLVTDRFGLDEVETALLEAETNPQAIKSMIVADPPTEG